MSEIVIDPLLQDCVECFVGTFGCFTPSDFYSMCLNHGMQAVFFMHVSVYRAMYSYVWKGKEYNMRIEILHKDFIRLTKNHPNVDFGKPLKITTRNLSIESINEFPFPRGNVRIKLMKTFAKYVLKLERLFGQEFQSVYGDNYDKYFIPGVEIVETGDWQTYGYKIELTVWTEHGPLTKVLLQDSITKVLKELEYL